MESLASLLIGAFLCYVLFLQIDEYNKLIVAKFKFRFFALRDRLSLMVIFEDLPEDSWEYKQTISTLNFHISATEKLSLTRIVELLADYHTSSEEEKRVRVFSRRVDRQDMRDLLAEFLCTAYDMIKRNSKAQMWFVKVIASVARKLHKEPTERVKVAVMRPSRALNRIEAHASAVRLAHAA